MKRWAVIFGLPVWLAACGDDGGTTDATADGSMCVSTGDCDDGNFCNGLERCTPGAANASGDGCVPGAAPCPSGTMCDEDADRCIDDCATMGDLDNDGEPSVVCGGSDCDDSNAAVAPGNQEVCDAVVDEDCNPSTVGTRDMDNDGYVDAACCNGEDNCGPDCNDANPAAHPDEAESCDGVDNDCDTLVDEGVASTCYLDADNDNFAPMGAAPMSVCGDCGTGLTGTAPSAVAADCDDSNADVYPGARELCNRLDDDCSSGGGADPAEDMDGDGHTDTAYTECETTPTTFPRTDCNDANPDVFGGQTQYFTTPLCTTMDCTCPSGARGCTNAMIGFCVCDDPASYDYDCDGVSSLEPEGCQQMCGGAMTSCGVLGPVYPSGGDPECSQLVSLYSSCGPGCFTAAGCNRRVSTGRPRRLGCR